MKSQKKIGGFTLIELLVSMAIIGLLAAILLPNFVGARQRAKDSQKIQELNSVKNALSLYYGDNQGYPDGSACDRCLDDLLKQYLGSISQIEYVYTQKDMGEGFLLTVALESGGGGNEDINSQAKCDIAEPEKNIYALCMF